MDEDDPVRIALCGVGRRHQKSDVEPGEREQQGDDPQPGQQLAAQRIEPGRRGKSKNGVQGLVPENMAENSAIYFTKSRYAMQLRLLAGRPPMTTVKAPPAVKNVRLPKGQHPP